jgi:hypothetical protein
MAGLRGEEELSCSFLPLQEANANKTINNIIN